MLRISDAQLNAIGQKRRAELMRKLEQHARTHFPGRCQGIGAEKLRFTISDVVARAEQRGLSTERALCLYLNVAMCFGNRFEEDRSIEWAAPIQPEPGEELDPCWIERVAAIAVRTLSRG